MTEPTDNELDTVLCNQWPAFSTQATLVRKWVRAAMRDAIAKWGAPPQISESDTDYRVRNRALILHAIEERGFRLVSSGGLFWLHGPSHPAQAGAVPLTDGQVESLLFKYGYDPDDEHMAAMLKEANGIKGGPHGTE